MRRSISQIFADRAREAPDEVVAIAGNALLTAKQLNAAASAVATRLRDLGVQRDDLVTLTLPNGIAFIVACVGIWRAGATPQPVATNLTARERSALEVLSTPATAIGRKPESAGIPWISEAQIQEALHAQASPILPDLAASFWKAPATSGSTGTPKIVLANAPALLDPTQPVAPFVPLRAVQLVAGPLTHSATFTYAFRGLMTGHQLVLLPRFDERAWLDAVEQYAVTWALVVPTMMHRLLRLPPDERDPHRLRSIQALLHIGAPCDPSLKRQFLAWAGATRVVEVYAGSESNGLTMIRGDEWLEHPGTVGRPVGGTELTIRRDDGTRASAGETGLVWMRRGETPAYAYLGATSRRDRHGWDTLGDLGYLDEHGYLYLVDRADDVINRGSEKIYPVDVEAVLESHPSVRSAVAFGMPDPEWGQQVAAVVDIADLYLEERTLLEWCRSRLGSRAPDLVHLVHDPVRSDAGKTSRRQWASLVANTRTAMHQNRIPDATTPKRAE